MTIYGKFKIEGSFKLRDRGLIIYGDIIDGKVSKKNFLAFNSEGQEIKLQIDDINFIDRTSENTSKVGLTFYYENDERKKRLNSLQVLNQTAKIVDD
jgi:hypothetical protein